MEPQVAYTWVDALPNGLRDGWRATVASAGDAHPRWSSDSREIPRAHHDSLLRNRLMKRILIYFAESPWCAQVLRLQQPDEPAHFLMMLSERARHLRTEWPKARG